MEKELNQNHEAVNPSEITSTPWDALMLNSEGSNTTQKTEEATTSDATTAQSKIIYPESDPNNPPSEGAQWLRSKMLENIGMKKPEPNQASQGAQELRLKMLKNIGIENPGNGPVDLTRTNSEEEWDGADGMYDDGPVTLAKTEPEVKVKLQSESQPQTNKDQVQVKIEPQPQAHSEAASSDQKAKLEAAARARFAAEAAAKARLEAEAAARAEIESEEIAKLQEEKTRIDAELIEKDEAHRRKTTELKLKLANLKKGQLVGINADMSYDREKMAKSNAESMFNSEKSKANFFKRARMNLFGKYYKKKYAAEIESGERKIRVGGKEMTLDEALKDRSGGAIERFISSIIDNDMDKLKKEAGEGREVDMKTTEAVRNAILSYAGRRGKNASERTFKRHLREELKKIQADSSDPNYFNNYFDIAERAIEIKDLANGTMSLEKVLEDFRVYNAKVYDSYLSDAHRIKIERALSRVEARGFEQIINPEDIIVAAKSASLIAKNGPLIMMLS